MNLEFNETHAILRLSGQMSFEQAVQHLKAAVADCRDRQMKRLLVHALQAEGIVSPTVSQRYWFITETAAIACGAVHIAMVVRPELIDPQKFGVTVAMNRNLQAQPFTDESEALSWLLKFPS